MGLYSLGVWGWGFVDGFSGDILRHSFVIEFVTSVGRLQLVGYGITRVGSGVCWGRVVDQVTVCFPCVFCGL